MYKFFLYDYELEWFHGNVHLMAVDITKFSKKLNFQNYQFVLDLQKKRWRFLGGNLFTSYLNYSPNLIIAYKTRIFPIKFFFFLSLCSLCSFTFLYFFFSSLFVDGTSLILFFFVVLCALLLYSDDVYKKKRCFFLLLCIII